MPSVLNLEKGQGEAERESPEELVRTDGSIYFCGGIHMPVPLPSLPPVVAACFHSSPPGRTKLLGPHFVHSYIDMAELPRGQLALG